MNTERQSGYTLHSVKNAMRILRLYSQEHPEWGVTEMSVKLGISKSNVHRLVTTLTKAGYLAKNPKTNRYCLGLSLLTLTGIITTHMEIHQEARPVLEALVEQLSETAHIGILEGADIVYLHKVECKHPVRLQSSIGKRNPAFCTGCGKAILAFQPAEVVDGVIKQGLQKYGPNSVTEPDELMSQLEQIRLRGYAVCIDELHEGVVSIGAPVYDYSGEVIAGVSVVGPKQRITSDDIPYYIKQVVKAGADISKRLGYFR